MAEWLLNQLVGLVIGLALGFYFERRAGWKTREQNKELRAELEALRNSIYTVGGDGEPREDDSPPSLDKLTGEVVEYARAFQDARGRVRKSLLVEHFASNGYLPGLVNQALDLARESGTLSVDEMWVTI